MKKLIFTLLCCTITLSLNAQLININWKKEIDKIVEAVLANPQVEKAIAEVETQYQRIINDYNKLNGELNAAIEQCKSVEQKLKNIILFIGIVVSVVCIVIPLVAGFLLLKRIRKSKFFRMGDNLLQIRKEMEKLNSQYTELLKANANK